MSGNFHQNYIAHGMTITIIDRLKTIKIYKKQTKQSLCRLASENCLGQPFIQIVSIGQISQRVMISHVTNKLGSLVPLCHILKDNYPTDNPVLLDYGSGSELCEKASPIPCAAFLTHQNNRIPGYPEERQRMDNSLR
jgi:hypothetical protein